MASKVKYNKEEAKALSLELQAEILKLKGFIDKLEIDVAILQIGNKDGAYWNGESAYDFHKSVTGYMDHDRTLVKNLEKCSEYIETTIK